MSNSDVIVIGAGMAGASLAYEAAADGQVQLLERETQPGYHATGRSAAAYIPSYGYTNPALRCLTLASRQFFDHPPAGFTETPLLQQRGLLTLAAPDNIVNFKASANRLQRWFDTATLVSGEYACAQVPLLKPDSVPLALHEPDVHDIDVAALHQGYLAGLKARGGRLSCAETINTIRYQAGAWVVQTNKDRYQAPRLVNAAGAWGDNIAQQAGVRPVGLTPLRRTVILIALPNATNSNRWPLVLAANGNYFKPEAGALLYSAADEHPSAPCDAQPEELDVAVAADLAQHVLSIGEPRITHRWAGLRTFTADRTPVIGFDAKADGFFWFCGQGGHGIQTAPANAKLAAALLNDDPPPTALGALDFDVQWVSPARTNLRSKT